MPGIICKVMPVKKNAFFSLKIIPFRFRPISFLINCNSLFLRTISLSGGVSGF